MSREIEDGMGFSGLVATRAEQEQDRRDQAERKRFKAIEAERDTLRTRVRDLEEAMLAISKGQGRFDKDNYRFACNVIEDMKAIANACLHRSDFDTGEKHD